MARLGLAGSSGNSSGTTAIEVPRTFEEQLEEAHGVDDEYLAEAMEPDSSSVVNPLAAMIVTDSREDVRGASSQPPTQTVAQEKVASIQEGLGSQPRSYTPPILNRGYAHGGMIRGYSDGSLVTAEEEHGLENPEEIGLVGRGFNWVKENPLEAAATAAMFIPVGGWAAGLAARGGLGAYKAYKAYNLAKKMKMAAGKPVSRVLGRFDDLTEGMTGARARAARGVASAEGVPQGGAQAGADWWATRLGRPPGSTIRNWRGKPTGKFRSADEATEYLGKQALRPLKYGAGIYGAGSVLGHAFGGDGESAVPPGTQSGAPASDATTSAETPAEIPSTGTPPAGTPLGVPTPPGPGLDGGGEDHPRKVMHPYMNFLREAYDRERIYGKESKKEARAILMLQMASNLSQPGATLGSAFDNLAPLVAAQGKERRRSDENTRNVLSEISLAMHRGELDLTDSETRNMIGVANAISRERDSFSRERESHASAAFNRGGGDRLKIYELAAETALAEVGGYRTKETEEKYQELFAKYLTKLSRFVD